MAHALIRFADDEVEDMDGRPADAGSFATDPPLFENAEWAVTDAGLGHKRTGYFIEREDLGRTRPDGLWAWPLHMLEKNWCAPQAFTEAFLHAVRAHGVAPDAGLERSFLTAGHAQAEWGMWERMARELGLRGSAPEPMRMGALAEVGAEICTRRVFGRVAGARVGVREHGTSKGKLRRHG